VKLILYLYIVIIEIKDSNMSLTILKIVNKTKQTTKAKALDQIKSAIALGKQGIVNF